MAQFFGGVSGQAGEATRLGSKRSGIRAYVQDNGVRLVVDMRHNDSTGKDIASIALTGGWTSYYRTREIVMWNAEDILSSLDEGDPKMVRIWDRILTEFAKLDAEAPKAVKRGARRRKIEDNRQKRAHAARLEREREFAKTVTDAEAEHFVALLDLTEFEIEAEDVKLRIANEGFAPEHKPYRDERGHLIVNNGSGSFRMRKLDLTDGIELTEVEA